MGVRLWPGHYETQRSIPVPRAPNWSERREPYWTVISKGCALGYRKLGTDRGTWIARFRDDARKQHYEALGASDDARDADGRTVFSFAQAQASARKFFDAETKRDRRGR